MKMVPFQVRSKFSGRSIPDFVTCALGEKGSQIPQKEIVGEREVEFWVTTLHVLVPNIFIPTSPTTTHHHDHQMYCGFQPTSHPPTPTPNPQPHTSVVSRGSVQTILPPNCVSSKSKSTKVKPETSTMHSCAASTNPSGDPVVEPCWLMV